LGDPNVALYPERDRDCLPWAWADEAVPVATPVLWLRQQAERQQAVSPARRAAVDEKLLAAHPEAGVQWAAPAAAKTDEARWEQVVFELESTRARC
jgi:hypothetical protein